jgi:hypothetical protein
MEKKIIIDVPHTSSFFEKIRLQEHERTTLTKIRYSIEQFDKFIK